MRKGMLLMLLSGLLLAGAAWLLVAMSDRKAAAAEAAAPATVQILVAARPLSAGARIGPETLGWAEWPATAVREGHLSKGAADPASLHGRLARRSIAAGEPLLASDLIVAGAGGTAAALLPPGRRAISLPVDPAGGLSGLAGPGDRVDVILTVAVGGGAAMGGRTMARTVVEDAPLLAVDGTMRRGGSAAAPQTVTLAVTPADAEALAVARELGRLSLVLRGAAADRLPRERSARWDQSVTGVAMAVPGAAAALPSAAAAMLPALPSAAAAAAPAASPERAGRVERVRGVEVVRGSVDDGSSAAAAAPPSAEPAGLPTALPAASAAGAAP